MRKWIAPVLVVALAALVLAGCSSPASSGGSTGGSSGGSTGGTSGTAPKTASVDISGFAFNPSSVEVAVGGTVTWKNSDSVGHTVSGSGWASGDLAQGATYSNTFSTAGTFPYKCSVHPSMTGDVVVK
jgi:plastocyanin